MGEQLAAAVAADGDERRSCRHVRLRPDIDDDFVGQPREPAQQARRIGLGKKLLAQRVTSRLQLRAPVRDAGLLRRGGRQGVRHGCEIHRMVRAVCAGHATGATRPIDFNPT
jgi:hypothetical protein